MSATAGPTGATVVALRRSPAAPGVPMPRPATVPARGPAAWVRMHAPSVGLLVLLTVGVAVVHVVGMTDNPARFEDEGTYVSQAWAIQTLGELAHYTYWYDHPPLGWIQIGLWTSLTGAFDRSANAIAAGREFMLVVQLLNCALLFAAARRVGMRRGFAALAVALFALSPLAIYFHRMVLLDNIAVMWALAAFVLALTANQRLWCYAAAGLCFALAALTKETTLLLLPALALAVWQGADRRTRSFCVTLFGSALVLVGSSYLLYAVLKGELLPGADHVSLWEGIEFQLFSRAPSGSLLDASSNARETFDGWMALDPWLVLTGALLAPLALLDRRLRALSLALVIQALMLLRTGYLPFPYVITMLPFAALVIAGVGDRTWGWRPLYLRQGGGTISGLPGGAARRAGRLRRAGPACSAAFVATLVLLFGSQWLDGVRALMTERPDDPYRGAVTWVAQNLDTDRDRLLVDSSLWLDVVRDGFGSGLPNVSGGPLDNVVWFYKLKRDPEVDERLPAGYRSLDYVISTPIMRASVATEPETAAALENSRIVRTFESGQQRVEIRKILKDGTR